MSVDKEKTEAVRKRVFELIAAEFESDAAFERVVGLPDKTVNNWRRGRSASFMKMLPKLSEVFRMPVSEILDMPLSQTAAELSEEEWHLLRLYRHTRTLPKGRRIALTKTVEAVINLYLSENIK